MWDNNAEAWTNVARAGYDIYRDFVNTPAFMAMLPEVSGLEGLDIGCGEGHNTRVVARRGAGMTALDISATFVGHARRAETDGPLGIRYLRASGGWLNMLIDAGFAIERLDEPRADEEAIKLHPQLADTGIIAYFLIIRCRKAAGDH